MSLPDAMSVDAARVASVLNFTVEANAKIPWEIVGPALVVSLVLLLAAYRERALIGAWFANSFIGRWRGNRRMYKLIMQEHEEELIEAMVAHIEDQVDQKAMTRGEANDLYRKYAKANHVFLHAISKLPVKEAIEHRRSKEERDSEGKVKPVNLPDKEALDTDIKPVHVHVL